MWFRSEGPRELKETGGAVGLVVPPQRAVEGVEKVKGVVKRRVRKGSTAQADGEWG